MCERCPCCRGAGLCLVQTTTGERAGVWHTACTTCCGSLPSGSPACWGRRCWEVPCGARVCAHVWMQIVSVCVRVVLSIGKVIYVKVHKHTHTHTQCQCKKIGQQVSWVLTRSTLNVFHLQMWTGALPRRRWPTTRRSRTACSSVASPTMWKPSGTHSAEFTVYSFFQNVLEIKRMLYDVIFYLIEIPVQEFVTVHFLSCCPI